MISRSGRLGTGIALVSAVLCLVMVGLAWGQTPSLENAASDLVLTEANAVRAPAVGAQAPAQTQAPATKAASTSGDAPVSLSLLDVAAKLALLVLAVYGATWGLKLARTKGWHFPRAREGEPAGRLVACEDLMLRGGACLHIVEVDRHPVLLATHASGQVSLLLDLSPPAPVTAPAREATPAKEPRAPGVDEGADSASALRLDGEWEERRDALIRALAQRA